MKIKLEFINGEERVIVDEKSHDFKVSASKIMQQMLVLTSENEIYPTNAIVKMEQVNET